MRLSSRMEADVCLQTSNLDWGTTSIRPPFCLCSHHAIVVQ